MSFLELMFIITSLVIEPLFSAHQVSCVSMGAKKENTIDVS